jgi:predicted transposase/invertase (TIGR01784 family)
MTETAHPPPRQPIDPHAPIGVSPRADVVFRKLFGEPEGVAALLALLNAVLQWPAPLTQLTRVPDALLPEQPDSKLVIIDVLAVDDEGRAYQIEMQSTAERDFAARALYGAAGLVRSRLQAGAPYSAMRPCISVWLCDQDVLPPSPGADGHPRPRRSFVLSDGHDQRPLTDLMQLHVVELSRLRRHSPGGPVHGPDLWLHFLAEGETWSRAALRAAAAESPALEYAMQVLHRFTEDEILRRQLEREEDRARILAGRAYHAERDAAEKAAALALLAEVEQQRAQAEQQREQAEREREQAEREREQAEQDRAQAEQQRAQAERRAAAAEQRAAAVEHEKAEAQQRADALAARLRALGIDPTAL